VRLHGNVRKRLTEVGGELARLRDGLAVIDEQVAYQRGVADDLEVRATVAESPLADRERREAAGDLGRLERQRAETAGRIATLVAEQDALLERLVPAAQHDG
jgi:hypothetical protein